MMATRRFRHRVATATCVALLAAPAFAADVEAHLDRTRVEPGESVELLIREQGGGSGAEPDLSPLSQDFEVQGVSQTQRTEIRNFDMQRSHDWVVTLSPRRSGRLEIPPIQVGSEHTPALALEVVGASAPNGGAPSGGSDLAAEPAKSGVLVEAQIDDPQPFVQGRSVLTLRVFARAGIVEATLAEPEVQGAIVERIGDDARSERTIAGERYDVVERRYSIVPQQSGSLEIPPVSLDAVVREPAPRVNRGFGGGFAAPFHDFFGNGFGSAMPRMGSLIDQFFGSRSRRVRVHSDPIALDVKPVPPGIELARWLPAHALELSETWSPDLASLHVGEQVTRTVTIRAAGVAPGQLPELEGPRVEGLKQYAEPASTASREIGGSLWSVKQQASVLVPTQPGTLALPAVEIAWYDVQANEPRTASLPARTLEVLEAPGAATPDSPAPAAATTADSHAPDTAPAAAQSFTHVPLDWRIAAAAGAAIGACVSAAALLVRRRRRAAVGSPSPLAVTPSGDTRPRALAAAFEDACRAHDPAAAAAALVGWGRACFTDTPPNTAGEVAERLGDPALRVEVDALNAARYAAAGAAWQGDALLAAWRAARERKPTRAPRESGSLPALYPTR
jgi:hypothetical protein